MQLTLRRQSTYSAISH